MELSILDGMFDQFFETELREKRHKLLYELLKNITDQENNTIRDYLLAYQNMFLRKYDWTFEQFDRISDEQIKPYIDMAKGFIYLNLGTKAHSLDEALQNYKQAEECFKSNIIKTRYSELGYASVLYQIAETKKVFGDKYNIDAGDSSIDREPFQLYDTAREILVNIDKDAIGTNSPVLWNTLGDIYYQLGGTDNLNNAKDYYEKANFSNAYNGMGRVLKTEMKWKEAIICFDKAIKANDKFNFPLVYMGDCHFALGDFIKAKYYYDQVLNNLGYDPNGKKTYNLSDSKTITFSLIGLGRIYYEWGKSDGLHQYNVAEQKYLEAKNISEGYAFIYMHYGRLLARTSQDTAFAREMFETALNLFDKRKNDSRKAEMQDYIDDLDRITKLRDPDNASNFMNLYPKEAQILDFAIKDIYPKAFSNKKRNFFHFLIEDQRSKGFKSGEFTLEVLRKWNSYTPLVMSSIGGGYFLNICGKGLVVDPGYKFIHNFRMSDHKFWEIDNVWVSHTHDDHTADLESIINLLYRYNKNLEEEYIALRYARGNHRSKRAILKIIKNDNAMGDDLENKEQLEAIYNETRKHITIFGCEEVKKKFFGIFELNALVEVGKVGNSKNKNKYVDLDFFNIFGELDIPITNDIDLHKLVGKHTSNKYYKPSHNESYGFYITYNDVTFVYTSDTAWDVSIEKHFKNIKPAANIVLVAHIGAFHEDELKFVDIQHFEKPFYENHLGVLGMVQIVKTLKPRVCIISEFGEEYAGLRAELVKRLSTIFKDEGTWFLPADIGLKLDFAYDDPKDPVRVRAVVNVDHVSEKIQYAFVQIEDVLFEEIKGLNSIVYYSSSITIGEVVDAIHSHYEGTKEYYYL